MIIAGQAKDLVAAVHAKSDGSQVTSALSCVAWLESSDSDDGKYWDATGDGSWQASPSAWPQSTHLQAGQHSWTLPAAATTGRIGSTVHYTFTDNLTEASSTTVCAGGEHSVQGGRTAVISDIDTEYPAR